MKFLRLSCCMGELAPNMDCGGAQHRNGNEQIQQVGAVE